MIGKKVRSVLGIMLALMISVGLVPFTVSAEYQDYQFLNPLGTIEPRRDTPLADRQPVIDILEGTGPRQIRIGTAWYMKPLDAEPVIGLGRLLEQKWEAMYPGLDVVIIPPAPGAMLSAVPPGQNHIPSVGHPWNNRADAVYDAWADRVDAVILGTGD